MHDYLSTREHAWCTNLETKVLAIVTWARFRGLSEGVWQLARGYPTLSTSLHKAIAVFDYSLFQTNHHSGSTTNSEMMWLVPHKNQ